MKRRHFLRTALIGAAAQVVAPGLLRAEALVSRSAEGFARGLNEHRWLAGWKSVDRESFGPAVASIEGKIPAGLAGVLYRNGPALFDRAGFRYQHWFDGDGLMQSWRIEGGAVRHHARMVATSKYVREQKAGRFLIPAAGTTVPGALPIRNNDDMNTANTAAIRVGDRLFALWEGGSAVELNPDDLNTLGPVTWREDLTAAPFSAHPLQDRDGTWWNFGLLSLLGGSGLLIWRIGAKGELAQVATLPSHAPGYLHSFAMTARYLIFMFTPITGANDGGAYFERMRFTPGKPCHVAVVPKDALDKPRWFETEFCATFHFADAHERGNEIVARTVRHHNLQTARSPMAAAMRGEREERDIGTELVGLRFNLATSRARLESYGVEGIEFPTFDTRQPGNAPMPLYAPVSADPNDAPYLNSIARIDIERDRHDVYRYGSDVMAEEHRFVPKPGSTRGNEGWLIGTVLDYRRGRSGLAVLDAERIADGPLALAWVPYTLPLAFHGWFARK
jgi:carotenoid cleavage dioxygenase-like enzyme